VSNGYSARGDHNRRVFQPGTEVGVWNIDDADYWIGTVEAVLGACYRVRDHEREHVWFIASDRVFALSILVDAD